MDDLQSAMGEAERHRTNRIVFLQQGAVPNGDPEGKHTSCATDLGTIYTNGALLCLGQL